MRLMVRMDQRSQKPDSGRVGAYGSECPSRASMTTIFKRSPEDALCGAVMVG